MVENSLGRIYIDKRKEHGTSIESLGQDKPNWDEVEAKRIANEKVIADKMGWKYYLPEAEQTGEVRRQLGEIQKQSEYKDVRDIKVIDPCMGSGHILVYAFDVLMQMYENDGYSQRDAAQSILEHNLYGLDIDDRAAQLAYFAVMMKARQYDRRIFSRGIQPHVYVIVESNDIDVFARDYFVNNDPKLKSALDSIINDLRDAKEYGSILTVAPVDFAALYARVEEVKKDVSLHREAVLTIILPLIRVAEVLAQQYDVVVTNPPYMGSSNMDAKLSEFVKKHYPDSKSDLFAVFIERCGQMTDKNRYQAMITQHAWMFLSSFEKLRGKLLLKDTVNMAHLGPRAFEEIGGEVVQTTSFVLRNSHIADYKGTYCRLIQPTTQQGKEDMFLAGENRYIARQSNFSKIPGSQVAYWVSDRIFDSFCRSKVNSIAFSDGQILTGDNEKYLRMLWEVEATEIRKDGKWMLHAKGGEFRKWAGNLEWVVKWSHDAIEHYKHDKIARFPKEQILFRRGVTWSLVSTNPTFGARLLPESQTFNKAAATVLFYDEKYVLYVLALLNSSVINYLSKIINPTLNNNIKDILAMPFIYDAEKSAPILNLTDENIESSQVDWDFYETSWDFKKHPLI